MQLNELQEWYIINMNEKRLIWFCDSLNHIPFSYGCIHNSENHLMLNLFRFERMKVCFGAEFFGDVGIVEYDGNYNRNNRNGWLCDMKNELILKREKDQCILLLFIKDSHLLLF